jgi:hypothetical protein
MKIREPKTALRFFISAIKRKFPRVDDQTIDFVINQALKEMAPSRDRSRLSRIVTERLKEMEKPNRP